MSDDSMMQRPDLAANPDGLTPSQAIDSAAISRGSRTVAAKVQEALDKTADVVEEKAAATSQKARAVLSAASHRVQATVDKIDPFVTERPYATFGIGLAAGVLIGLLLAGRGPKVIYVKPRDPARH